MSTSRSKYQSIPTTAIKGNDYLTLVISHPSPLTHLRLNRTQPRTRQQQLELLLPVVQDNIPALDFHFQPRIFNDAPTTHLTMPTNVVIPPTARQAPQPERAYEVERDIKAKFVPSPQKLLEELRRVVGPEEYYSVEMRHNVYKIRASTDFDMQKLISSF